MIACCSHTDGRKRKLLTVRADLGISAAGLRGCRWMARAMKEPMTVIRGGRATLGEGLGVGDATGPGDRGVTTREKKVVVVWWS